MSAIASIRSRPVNWSPRFEALGIVLFCKLTHLRPKLRGHSKAKSKNLQKNDARQVVALRNTIECAERAHANPKPFACEALFHGVSQQLAAIAQRSKLAQTPIWPERRVSGLQAVLFGPRTLLFEIEALCLPQARLPVLA